MHSAANLIKPLSCAHGEGRSDISFPFLSHFAFSLPDCWFWHPSYVCLVADYVLFELEGMFFPTKAEVAVRYLAAMTAFPHDSKIKSASILTSV